MTSILFQNFAFLLILLFWVLPWKGVALWKSARNGDKYWFIILLLVQTLAILDIIYIFIVSKKKEEADIPIPSSKL